MSLLNRIAKLIGWSESTEYISDISDEESSDSEYFSNDQDTTTTTSDHGANNVSDKTSNELRKRDISNHSNKSMNATDAAVRTISMPSPESVLDLNNLEKIESELCEYEIASLVFLLYERDMRQVALQELQIMVLSAQKRDLLQKWARYQESCGDKKWQLKLVEALCIIQNYKVLKELGFSKNDLKARFCPNVGTVSEVINRDYKMLYCIAEKLNKHQTDEFLKRMKTLFKQRGLEFLEFACDYLELYFLDWESKPVGSFHNIKKVLKAMDLESLTDSLADVTPTTPEVTVSRPLGRPLSMFMDTTQEGSSRLENNESMSSSLASAVHKIAEDDCYFINPENPGLVLIINQEDFHTEFESKYAHLLYPENARYKLENRLGTEKDKNRLEQVFKRFNFKVVVETNLPHYEMIKVITEATESIKDESSLFVCILSHGGEGVVYGSNSCYVKVKQIESIMVKKNKNHLRGKPKVLILQSCQGTQCQKIEEEDSDIEGAQTNAHDGPNVPLTADMLTFWATVPGYAAIRNINKGSWLIQTLCDEIENNWSKYHLQDICTRVVDKVTQRKWKESKDYTVHTNIMTPLVVSTFRKRFCLPSVRV